MISLFAWLREKCRNAVLAGIADAVEELNPSATNGYDEAIAAMQKRLEYRDESRTESSRKQKVKQ